MEAATPIRRQYLEVKRRYPNAIVFFRLGDFYETFDDDAKLVAKELDITLTSKPMGKGLRVPLAGVPHHSLEGHLRRLVSRGFKVAICEQMEDPRQAKGIVEREVVRVVTPGTVVEEALLSPATNNYLAAVIVNERTGLCGLAYIDVSTGEFACAGIELASLDGELARVSPTEVLVPEGLGSDFPFPGTLTPIDRRLFEPGEAERLLCRHFNVTSVEAFGLRGASEATAAAGAVLAYLEENQRAALANVRDLRVFNPAGFLVLDPPARRHLEIFATARDGDRRGSLLDVVDLTRTGMGARLLARWLGQPLVEPAAIEARLDRVAAYHANGVGRAALRDLLGGLPDIERIAGRCVAGSAAPRDLAALRRGLDLYPAFLDAAGLDCDDAATATIAEIAALLAAAIADEPANAPGDGGVIRAGYSAPLDEARGLTGDARSAIAALEAEERERTGIRSLRVAYNRVFGYYLEVSNTNLGLVPADFQRKQTLVGAERFVTPALKELEEKIDAAREVIGDLEGSLFRGVCAAVAAQAGVLQEVAGLVAQADVFATLAEVAARGGWVRPEIDNGDAVDISDGRHPVVERNLGAGRFVPNDVALDTNDTQIIVLTGPNMAGKSTYLRQVALIVLLAQCGSFVPATKAKIGVVDRIFTRIGAQDDVGRGESTFMVEMLETAAILRNATRRSLVVFDEVGRGTSTYDGLAIARAVVEYLHASPERMAKTLFATHYHEMTALAGALPRVRNFSVAVTEQDGEVVFLHRIVAGGADRSYGIHVAELAGMPAGVIDRAREVLASLEADGRGGRGRTPLAPRHEAPQLSLMAPPSAVEADLRSLSLDELTPLQALTKLYELRAKATPSS